MLRLSREADYSLLAMIYIAGRPDGQLAYRREIAAHYSIPKDFLAKVLQKLARGGLVRSFRGTQGGYCLARKPDEITLVDVLEAVEGPMSLVDCGCEPYECRQEQACTIKRAMHEVQNEIRSVLGGVSLQDMRSRLPKEERERLITLETSRK